jgi:uncharacterized protein
MEKVDKKGLIWFLLLTFGSTYAVEFAMMFKGISFMGMPSIAGQFIVAGVMFFPGIAAFIVRRFITQEGFKDAGLKIGKVKNYLQPYLLIPLIFAVVYGFTWIFIQKPDFSLQGFINQYGLTKLPFPSGLFILGVIVSSLTFAPFLNAIPAFGEEFGWRGYLLPKLLPLGTKKALILSGLIWGLWHAPLILMGYRYGNLHVLGIILFSVLLIFLGIYFGYLRLTSGSVYLAAFAHGVFNAQAYGVWTVIFPNVNPALGGFAGITGILVFFILGLWIFKKPEISKHFNE